MNEGTKTTAQADSNCEFGAAHLTESVVLQRMQQWETMRQFWLAALRENPHLVERLEPRTRENLGL